jgi:hypothetical protein
MTTKQTKVEPSLRTTDPRFKPTRGADVQVTWRKFGWVPPSEYKPAPVFVEKVREWEPVRRVK